MKASLLLFLVVHPGVSLLIGRLICQNHHVLHNFTTLVHLPLLLSPLKHQLLLLLLPLLAFLLLWLYQSVQYVRSALPETLMHSDVLQFLVIP